MRLSKVGKACLKLSEHSPLHSASIFGTQQGVLNTEVSLFQGCLLRGVPLYICTYMYVDNKIKQPPSHHHIQAIGLGLGVWDRVEDSADNLCLVKIFKRNHSHTLCK